MALAQCSPVVNAMCQVMPSCLVSSARVRDREAFRVTPMAIRSRMYGAYGVQLETDKNRRTEETRRIFSEQAQCGFFCAAHSCIRGAQQHALYKPASA